ncbi:hypothetical protein HMPREF9176_0376 [Streptococcus downei F0415]|nr:hypothetical protein HMPREF9176_0376 [Streptococcus downei F0415]
MIFPPFYRKNILNQLHINYLPNHWLLKSNLSSYLLKTNNQL